jgi:hypothetical protein
VVIRAMAAAGLAAVVGTVAAYTDGGASSSRPVYVAIGNGAAASGPWDGSEWVNKLSPTLQRLSYFAPSYWAADNVHDYDLGSTQPALVDGDSLFSMGKRGVGYLLNATSLGGIGGQEADLPICMPFGAASVDGSTVYEPCSSGGTAAIALNPASKTIRVL